MLFVHILGFADSKFRIGSDARKAISWKQIIPTMQSRLSSFIPRNSSKGDCYFRLFIHAKSEFEAIHLWSAEVADQYVVFEPERRAVTVWQFYELFHQGF